MELFRVRLNCVDHYQAIPTPLDPQLFTDYGTIPAKERPKVPVIRVFGATQTGQKVCAHIHGALPYLYVEYDGSLAPDEVEAYTNRLHLSIDHALGVSYRRNPYEGRSRFVGRISLVKGVPFYGYHVGYKFFLKIYVLNPLNMTRLADLLRQGTIMNRIFQPFESHLQYLLQWMCDFNLYGCGYIDCRKVLFRLPVPKYDQMEGSMHLWHDQSISTSQLAEENRFPRQSHCSIEVDICVKDILNRHDIKLRPLHQDFVERSNPLSMDERLVQSMAGLWRDETKRRKSRMPDAEPGSSPFPPEVLISMSADPRNSQRGGWIHEEEFMTKIRELVHDEQQRSSTAGPMIKFEHFVEKNPMEDNVKTTLESIEDLFPENLASLSSAAATSQPYANNVPNVSGQDIVVDESRVRSLGEGDFSFDSDEDLGQEIELLPEGAQGTDQREEGRKKTGAKSKPGGTDYQDQSPDLSDASLDDDSPKHSDGGNIDMIDSDNPTSSANQHEVLNAGRITGGRKRRRSSEPDQIHARTATGLMETMSPSLQPFGQSNSQSDLSVNLPRPMKSDVTEKPLGTREHDFSKNMSQESIKASKTAANKTLSFPVVKDPHDPDTIHRLSQRSASSQKARSKKLSSQQTNGSGISLSQEQECEDGRANFEVSAQSQKLATNIRTSFGPVNANRKLFCFMTPPPVAAEVTSSLKDFDVSEILYQDAYYSNEKDVPDRPREYAGRDFRLESNTVPFLPDFNPFGISAQNVFIKSRSSRDRVDEQRRYRLQRKVCGLRSWEIAQPPPTKEEIESWVVEQDRTATKLQPAFQDLKEDRAVLKNRTAFSQVDGPTQKHRYGFKFSQKQKTTSVQHEAQYMSLMGLEVHVNTRGRFVPDPEQDEISCIFWALQSDDEDIVLSPSTDGSFMGILALSPEGGLARKIAQHAQVHVEEEPTELDVINRIVDIVRAFDPDILTGFEVHGGSWGYLIERARVKYDFDLCDEFSRMKSQSHGRFGKENDRWGFNHTSTIRVTGRHMINIWRAMRSELNLLQYTLQNIAFHLLHRRLPHYHFQDLTRWYQSGKPADLAKVINHYITRVQVDLEILEQNELIPRTSEQARLLGVDFFSVFSRGSQFKVESLMFRIAKPEAFLLPSPSRKQVGQQNALECLPLVMEPQSDFYSSPMLVLDFQSLYPSVMIAYNYCYSTFLGRVVDWRGQNKMGYTDYTRQERMLELLEGQINISPNGMMYVKPEIRKSLLAKMLGEILETRVMVKSGMKEDKDDKTLQRLLNNRQLALKLIANVTYGYTSASFSGRMPCSEIADSIVQTGRETLEKAIALIHSEKRWGAEVVYGDTDSLFVYLKGRSKSDAFQIGRDIADTITKMNPQPVKLKFEKVYLPCVLLAKKRYVGFKYETESQLEPEFDAKGIETVRRDGTPAEQKIEEKALKILFRTADLSRVKYYFQQQCSKIMKGQVSIQDFCFAKEVKLGTYSDRGLPPPGAMISTKRMLEDPRTEPQYGERVPYVVITGAPGARLIDRCVAPETLLQDEHNELDAEYYISKNLIPPLERIFNLVGANVRSWYDEMPKFQRIRQTEGANRDGSKDLIVTRRTLESYMKSSLCMVCRERLESGEPICPDCLADAQHSLLKLRARLVKSESKSIDVRTVCRSCSGLAFGEEVRCDSKDCPIFYTRVRQDAHLRSNKAMLDPVIKMLEESETSVYDW
ncbi:MAG: hypothetical protein M4579_006791 [Chaenotheca gracillima]|nr:MAG: hypothetical protein M4579_006791 [Chaenotheca gracillima]